MTLSGLRNYSQKLSQTMNRNVEETKVLSQSSTGLRKGKNIWRGARFMDSDSNPWMIQLSWPIHSKCHVKFKLSGRIPYKELRVRLPTAPRRSSIHSIHMKARLCTSCSYKPTSNHVAVMAGVDHFVLLVMTHDRPRWRMNRERSSEGDSIGEPDCYFLP